jgi:hypothetical protein
MRKYLVRVGNTISKSKILHKRKTTYRHWGELPWDCGLCAPPYIDQDEVAWAFDTRVNRPLRYCYILAPESVLHIAQILLTWYWVTTTLAWRVDYYLSVHNSGKIYLQHHHWYYIHTYTRYTFFLNSSLFMMALS